MEPLTWSCAICAEEHRGLATVFGPAAPDPWAAATDEQRASGELNADQCVLPLGDTTHHFLRGQLEIPVHDAEIGSFVWSVWVSLSAASMELTLQHWDDPERASLPPLFGWLCTWLSPYEPPTVNLATNVHTRAPGVAPRISLDPSVDHPLVREQVEGITRPRVVELNSLLFHG